MTGLSQIGESHNVTRVVIVAALVCDPHLYPGYLNAGDYVGEHRHVGVVIVTEEMGQEEVTVLVITAGIYLKVIYLLTSLRVYGR